MMDNTSLFVVKLLEKAFKQTRLIVKNARAD